MAWAKRAPKMIPPLSKPIRYIGETGEFRRRMDQFACSAGLWGDRGNGHSAGWRWPKGQAEWLWISFHSIDPYLQPHVARGYRCWMEAVALEEYRVAWNKLPEINRIEEELTSFD
jgi:hypothetical protein